MAAPVGMTSARTGRGSGSGTGSSPPWRSATSRLDGHALRRGLSTVAGLSAALLLALPLPGAALEDHIAAQSGCSGGALGYVAGYFAPADPSSGVFWCRRDERYAAEGRVVIVVVDRRATPRLACPSTIVAINEPARLRVLHDPKLPLTAFVVRHEPWRTGPAGQVTAGPVVDAVDGAVGEQWVCHRGAWLVRVYH